MLPKDKPDFFLLKLVLGIASIDLFGLRNPLCRALWLHLLPLNYLGCLRLWEGQWLVLGHLTLGLELCFPGYTSIAACHLKNSSAWPHFQVNFSTKDLCVCLCVKPHVPYTLK